MAAVVKHVANIGGMTPEQMAHVVSESDVILAMLLKKLKEKNKVEFVAKELGLEPAK